MPDTPSELTGAYEPPAAPPERFASGAMLASRYRVVAPLGKGGMGEVYRADDLTLAQPVALKFLPLHISADPDRLARFRREVAAARKVSHPNVCRVYDIAEHAGQSFLTMEFVDGEDLSSVLKRLGRVPEEKGIEIARQLCSALAAVHDQGLLHRDLKPANVMLDGRGKVRLTDFGLAAAAEDLSASEVRSGTPLYQAPEQLAGTEVTVRSDLFALGLVLYELFTGKRAFADKSRDSAPSKPSSHVSGLNPTVEAIILKCLAPDPAERPRSAIEVLSRLPGGDPLAAAVAAGETPSPKMVADAPLEGTLRPGVALALFAVVVAGLLVLAGLYDRYKAHRHIPLPPPAVLEEKARQMVRDLGHTDPPADTYSGFEMPPEHHFYMARHDSQPAATREQMPTCRPALAVYWHRQSPRPLVPVTYNDDPGRSDRLSSTNPPANVPGMITLRIDTRGRLVGLVVIPDPDASPPVQVGWDVLLKAAELDAPGVLRPDPAATVTPPVFADRTAVWDGAYPERPDLAIRVEAASYRGRPVYFRISHPEWGAPPRDRPVPIVDQGQGFYAVIDIVYGILTVAVLFLAVRNIRRGRADLRGALVLAAIVIVFQMVFWLLAGGHFPRLGLAFTQFVNELGSVLFAAGLASVNYLALEPLIRRRCPHRLTAWNRLIAGRWRDPLIGRHVLIGMAVAVVCSVDFPALQFLPSRSGPTVVHPHSFTHPVGELAGNLVLSVGTVWIYAGVFAVLLAVTRRDWAATTLLGVFMLLTIVVASGLPVLGMVFGAVRVAVGLALLLRFGILAMVAWLFTVILLLFFPLTLDTSAWYFGASLVGFAAVVGLAAYGLLTAVGGARLFEGRFFGDD